MDHAMIWRKMADKWFEIAQETSHPALKKCYRDKALRFRVMASMAEHGHLAGDSEQSIPPERFPER